MRILVTGSRDWTNRNAIGHALMDGYRQWWSKTHPDPGENDWMMTMVQDGVTLVHGDCRGADRIAADWARQLGWTVEPHPADWKMGKAAGRWRNQHMVKLGADVCLAFYLTGAENSGTQDCVAKATEADIPVLSYREPW